MKKQNIRVDIQKDKVFKDVIKKAIFTKPISNIELKKLFKKSK